jgi:hypothetical protein
LFSCFFAAVVARCNLGHFTAHGATIYADYSGHLESTAGVVGRSRLPPVQSTLPKRSRVLVFTRYLTGKCGPVPSGDCTRRRKSRTNRPRRELHGPSVPGIACTWHHEETHIADTSSKCLSRGANQGRVACQEKESLRRMRQLPQYSRQLKEGTVTKNMATATQQAMVCSSLVSLFHVERKQQDRTSWTAHGG